MSVAVAQVKQIITIQGVDNASATVAKAQGSLKGLETSAGHVAEKAGDMERGFRGVKDIIGQVGGQQMQELTDKFGGVEAILKGFGPKFGAIGLGVAAVAAGVAYWYEQQEKVRKTALETQIATIKHNKDDIAAAAVRLNVSAELLGASNKQLTAEEVVSAAKSRNNELDTARIALAQAQIDKQPEKIAGLEAEIRSLQVAIQIDQTRLDLAKEEAAAKRLGSALDIKNQRIEIEHQQKIASNLDVKSRLEKQSADTFSKRYALTANESRVHAEIKQNIGVREEQERLLLGYAQQRGVLDAKDRQAAAEGAALAAERAAKEKAASAAAAARRKKLRDANFAFAQDEIKDEEAKFQATKDINNRTFLAAEASAAKTVEVTKQASDATAAVAKAKASTEAARLREVGDIDGAILIERGQALADYAAEVKRINDEIDKSEEALDLKQEQRDGYETTRKQKTLLAKMAVAATTKRLEDEATARVKDNVALIADSVRGPADLLGRLDAGNKGLATGLNTAAGAVGKVAKGWKGLKASAPDAISASGEIAAAFVDDEQTKATILAVSETAAAVALAFTPGRQAEAAGHFASAALYAGIAGGVIGSSGGGSGGAGAGAGGSPGGLNNTAPTGGISTAAPVGGGNVTINFNQPLVTKQEVGKVVQNALRSIGQTGMAKAKGV